MTEVWDCDTINISNSIRRLELSDCTNKNDMCEAMAVKVKFRLGRPMGITRLSIASVPYFFWPTVVRDTRGKILWLLPAEYSD